MTGIPNRLSTQSANGVSNDTRVQGSSIGGSGGGGAASNTDASASGSGSGSGSRGDSRPKLAPTEFLDVSDDAAMLRLAKGKAPMTLQAQADAGKESRWKACTVKYSHPLHCSVRLTWSSRLCAHGCFQQLDPQS